jgi:hypothetical protein
MMPVSRQASHYDFVIPLVQGKVSDYRLIGGAVNIR